MRPVGRPAPREETCLVGHPGDLLEEIQRQLLETKFRSLENLEIEVEDLLRYELRTGCDLHRDACTLRRGKILSEVTTGVGAKSVFQEFVEARMCNVQRNCRHARYAAIAARDKRVEHVWVTRRKLLCHHHARAERSRMAEKVGREDLADFSCRQTRRGCKMTFAGTAAGHQRAHH